MRGGLRLRAGRVQSRFYRGGIKAGMGSFVFPASSQEGGGFERSEGVDRGLPRVITEGLSTLKSL